MIFQGQLTMTAEAPIQTNSVSLPEGYSQRLATLDDAEAVARVYTAAYQERGEDEIFTAEYFLSEWQEPKWDLATSSQVVLNAQGEIVGCVTVRDDFNPAHPWLDWDVTPGTHWQAVTQVLIAWGEQRALQAMAKIQPEERFGPCTDYNADAAEQVAFIESLGYNAIRYFYRMGITLQEPPTVLAMPDGLTLRTFDYPAELEAVVAAKDDMWQDHYGYTKRPLSEIVERWRHNIETDAKFDASLWYVATDTATGEIAGLVLCRIEDFTQPKQGYILIVAVRRAYRKKGLAQAMLTHAFAEYWQRGQKTVCLGVDASSPTGATRLYERVGMSPVVRYTHFEKEIRPGVERMNTGD